MTQEILQPPFTLKFREMARKELKAYSEWFHAQIPDRIMEVAKAVQLTPGYESWQADLTPASLVALGLWFAEQVEMRTRTQAEINEIRAQLSYPIEIPSQELTNRTFLLAMDIGMYLSQVFLLNHRSLKWDQSFGNRKFIDYGQPVLVEFTSAPFNPIRMMVTQAYGMSDKTWGGNQLRKLYDIWSGMIRT
jgi:hypothetical protein